MVISELSATSLGFRIGFVGAALFLLWGMLLGVWKYLGMRQGPDHSAPMYVDIGHRAALLYSFASLVLAMLAEFSAWAEWVNASAVAANLLFFGAAVATYTVHGWWKTEKTQFRHENFITTWGMWALIAAEIGGTAVLVGGVIFSLW